VAGALARLGDFDHICFMVGRPCNPNSDLKRLWQFLLADAPFPQCGSPAETGTAGCDETQLAKEQRADAKEPAADPGA
jgi:hypothetical protein